MWYLVKAKQYYHRREASKICGLAYGTLLNYEKRGLITAPARDTLGRRIYTVENLYEICTVYDSLHSGKKK